MRMAQLYANAGQPEKAVSEYRAVLASQPNSLATLNNLAGLLTATNPAEAVTFARRAHGVAPDSPAIADTLGMALMAAGNVAEARSLLKQAYDALPANATVKMHYAQALLASGERDDARRLLLTIANKPFEGSQQVAELLKELQ
jgi:predicted Zn-dependent protease